MGKSVLYICHGDFNYLSRAKRQINTLLEHEYIVKVINGLFIGDPVYKYPFDIEKHKIMSGSSRLFNFIELLWFNFKLVYIAKGDYNIIICRELSVLLAGVLSKLSRLGRVKLVFDSNELSVETKTGVNKLIWGIFQKILIQFCDVIIHAEINRLKYFVKTYPIINKRVEQFVIENYPYLNRNMITYNTNNVKAVYFGGVSEGRGIEEIIMAFKDIANCSLDIIGFGSEEYYRKLSKLLSDNEITNVNFLKPVNDAEIYDALLDYRIGFAFYANTNLNNYYCAPNKVYQYVQNNMAVITTNNPPLVEFVEKYKIGVCIDTVDAKNIKNAINKIIMMSLQKNITLDLKKQYSWEAIESDFIQLIGGI